MVAVEVAVEVVVEVVEAVEVVEVVVAVVINLLRDVMSRGSLIESFACSVVDHHQAEHLWIAVLIRRSTSGE